MKIRWLFLPILLISGCATVPPSKDVMSSLARANPVPLMAIKLQSGAPLLSTHPIEGDLGPGAPVVELMQGNSYYRLYRLSPVNGTLHLKVTSYCACLGMDKRIAVPIVRVLTKTGQVVNPSPDGYDYSVEGQGSFTPLSMALDVTVPGADANYALVASDNSHLDTSITRINFDWGNHLDILTYPIGRFDVRYIVH
ncbi:hypothetical protein [Rhodanobacter denitrificans]|uniref:hypothetical protein n=1 Tax=Rhodanobacter denitrificans TaxID=666685 RepID=UPI0018CAAB54|nr:hypothetical protein [Rhodanobacter denitrificans]UJJ50375.1 hypothetical protein LRK52_14220 [Rhodanobacter denitrificans]